MGRRKRGWETTPGAYKRGGDASPKTSGVWVLRKLKPGKMGSDGGVAMRKPRFLCLHGFRTSADILQKQVGKWPESVLGQIDLVFADAPFPSHGKSDVEGVFDPPYYEWFQFNKVIFLFEFSEIYLYLINILGLFWRKICGFWFTSGVYGVHELRWVSCVHWRLYDKARSIWRALGFLAGICCLRFLIFCLVAEKNEGKTRNLTASFSLLLPFFFKKKHSWLFLNKNAV